jgi:peroxisomal membrane protein 2
LQAITASLIALASDLIAQRLGGSSRARVNWRRSLSIALYGLIWTGPSNHYWLHFLERLFPNKNDPLRPAKKVAFDQLTYGPLNNIMFMLYISMIVEGRSWKATSSRIRADYPNVQVNGWRLWPLAQFINQSFVPLELRVLWSNMVALIWTTFMITRAKTAGRVPGPKLPTVLASKEL